MQSIDVADYKIKVRNVADELSQELEAAANEDDPVQIVEELVAEEVWFQSTLGGLSGADYGAIIAEFDWFNSEKGDYHWTLGTIEQCSDDPETILRNLAKEKFISDVLQAYADGDHEYAKANA